MTHADAYKSLMSFESEVFEVNFFYESLMRIR